MAQETPADSGYTVMGYSEEMIQSLMRRNSETNAAHLLPHLRPGLRVLDIGCGPGTYRWGWRGPWHRAASSAAGK